VVEHSYVVEHRKVMRFFGDGDMTASRVIK